MDFHKVARRWQKKWRAAKCFESDAGDRPKFFLNTPYPYANGYPHVGHLYTYMRGDVIARYKRMRGFHVLYPQSWHATGSPIYAAARRVKEGEQKQVDALKMMGIPSEDISRFEDPAHWIKVFTKVWEEDLNGLGFSIDWRRSFITTDLNPRYSKFIEWQFRKLKEKKHVVKGSHPVVWSTSLGLPVGDHDRAEGEGETPQEMVLVKFSMDGFILPTGTFRPETTFGVTNIWVNPDLLYVKAKVDGEDWILVEDCVEKLRLQKRDVEVVETLKGSSLVGKVAKNPVTGDSVPLLPASFVSADTGSGVVMSVPAHAPYDFVALMDIKSSPDKFGVEESFVKDIEPIGLITVEGYGEFPAKEVVERLRIKSQDDPELEQATHEVYKKEFHTGRLSERTGKYKGLSITDAKDRLIADFKEAGFASSMWELINPVISRALDRCVVKIVDNQWFVDYADKDWKRLTMKCLEELKLYPEKVRPQFEYVVDWLREWACTREYGLGTKLPWDKKWVIESLSDSTIYMSLYTFYHLLKKVNLGSIDDRLFDYVLLGEGDPGDIDLDTHLLNSMREEFTYWYPFDLRNSAKDLVQNHLAFCLFNHTAIFPEKYWPGAFAVNGYVSIQKQKMSKSKGNFRTVREVVKEFSPDPVRMTILQSGEELNDVDWDPDVAAMLKTRLENLYSFCLDNYRSDDDGGYKAVDRWMDHMLHCCIRDATKAMDDTLFRSAIMRSFFDLQRHLKWYLRRTAGKPNGKVISDVIDAQVRMLCPFCPHVCEEVWEKLGHEEFLSLSDWPSFDESKINPAIEDSEALVNTVLDDVAQVIKLAKVDKPTKVKLFVGASWKFDFIKSFKEVFQSTRNISEIMKTVLPDFKDRSKEVSQLVQRFVKDPSKLPVFVSNNEAEYQFVKDSLEFLESEFGCTVEVYAEAETEEPKAKSAMPGKPAILVQ